MAISKAGRTTSLWFNAENLSSETKRALEALYRRYAHLRDLEVYVLFSGGLDTSFLAHFFQHVVCARVTGVYVNVGSVLRGLTVHDPSIAKRANALGIQYAFVDGISHLEQLLVSAVRAEAQLFRGHHPASSLSRVAIARAICDFASEAMPAAIVHGSDRHQNNPFRYFNAFKTFGDSSTEVIAPHLDDFFTRDSAAEYLDAAGISFPRDSTNKISSVDDNIFGLEAEDAAIDDPTTTFDMEEILGQTRSFLERDSKADIVELEFGHGVPTSVSINGIKKTDAPIHLLDTLNRAMLPHRIGIVDYYEPRPQGREAREIHCAPGFSLMILARHLLRRALLDPLQNRRIERLSTVWSEFVIGTNLWTHELRGRADQIFDSISQDLSGVVRLRVRYKSIDLPSIHPKATSRSRHPGVNSEQLQTLFDAQIVNDASGDGREGCDEIAKIVAKMDDVIERTYNFFSVEPPVCSPTLDMRFADQYE